jgi:hypothetical protein
MGSDSVAFLGRSLHRRSLGEFNDFLNGLYMLSDSRFHRWRHAQGLMDPREIVVHVEQRHGMRVIFDLLPERIGEPREPAHLHPHREVLPLDIGRADVLRVRASRDVLWRTAKALARAVARLAFRRGALDLVEHRVIDVRAERIFDRRKIHPVAAVVVKRKAKDSRINITRRASWFSSWPSEPERPVWRSGCVVGRRAFPVVAFRQSDRPCVPFRP